MSGKQCPKCGGMDIEIVDFDIIDQVDEDATTKYFWATYIGHCLGCGEDFNYEDDYTEAKQK